MAKRPPKSKSKSKAEVKTVADRAEARSKSNKKADLLPKPETAVEAAVNKGHKLISQNNLRNLLRTVKNLESDKDETVGMIREKIGYAKEKQNLLPKVFAEMRRLDKMEAEVLAAYEDARSAYMDMLGLTERIESVPKLPLEDRPADDGGGDEPTASAGTEPPPPEGTVSRPRLSVVGGEATNKIPA